jgi:hypothetical protein
MNELADLEANSKSQRAMIAVQAAQGTGHTVRSLAAMAGMGKTLIGNAWFVFAHAPDLVAGVLAGDPLDQAVRTARDRQAAATALDAAQRTIPSCPATLDAARRTVVSCPAEQRLDYADYLASGTLFPRFRCGDALAELPAIPPASVGLFLGSPPYYGLKRYPAGGIGEEEDWRVYIATVCATAKQMWPALVPMGILALVIDDVRGPNGGLRNLPGRIATQLTDEQGWVHIETPAWDKGTQGLGTSPFRLRHAYEQVLIFAKGPAYFHGIDAVRLPPRPVSPASGIEMMARIACCPLLSAREKANAQASLARALSLGLDVRLRLRGDRIAHAGTARTVERQGFAVITGHPKGARPTDVLSFPPDRRPGRGGHPAPYPEALVRFLIRYLCPPGAPVVDPWCGSGTTNLVAWQEGHPSVGIDIDAGYIEEAEARCRAAAAACYDLARRP